MKITKIQPQKKRPDRYSVYIDDKFAFGLSNSDLLSLGLKINQELGPADLRNYQAWSTLGKSYDKALGYLAIRLRSEKEVRDYLRRKQFDKTTEDATVAKLQEAGLLDDGQFAREWVQWRQGGRPRSRQRLIQELRSKGIDRDTISSAVAEVDVDAEIEQVRLLISKHRSRYDSEQKLMAYLSRQGYGYDVIKTALTTESEE